MPKRKKKRGRAADTSQAAGMPPLTVFVRGNEEREETAYHGDTDVDDIRFGPDDDDDDDEIHPGGYGGYGTTPLGAFHMSGCCAVAWRGNPPHPVLLKVDKPYIFYKRKKDRSLDRKASQKTAEEAPEEVATGAAARKPALPVDLDEHLDLGDRLIPRSWDSMKLSQAEVNKVNALIEGRNLSVSHGTVVPYAPAEGIDPLPVGVPSVCLRQDPEGMFILLKVQTLPRPTKDNPQNKSVKAWCLPAGDLPAGEAAAGDIPSERFSWSIEELLKTHKTKMWWDVVCKNCVQFVPAGVDQDAYLKDLIELGKTLAKGLGTRMNNTNPCKPLEKKRKIEKEKAADKAAKKAAKNQQDNAGRDARRARLETIHATLREQYQPEIENALVQNTIARQKRDADAKAAADAAVAAAGLQGQGRGPAPAAAGQSSQGQGPAAAAAGDGDLPPQDQALLAQLRIYCKDPEKREVCDRARVILGKRNRGKQRAKQRESSGSEEAEFSTEDEDGEKILPVRSKRQRKRSEPLTMHNLVISVNDLGSVLNTPKNKQKSEAKGTNSQKSEAKGTNSKAQQRIRSFRIIFKNKDERVSEQLYLESDKAPWGHILPQEVHSVKCLHEDVQFLELNMEFDVDNYRTFVADLAKDHLLVKFLQKRNIQIPKKEQTATLPLSATTRSDPCPSQT